MRFGTQKNFTRESGEYNWRDIAMHLKDDNAKLRSRAMTAENLAFNNKAEAENERVKFSALEEKFRELYRSRKAFYRASKHLLKIIESGEAITDERLTGIRKAVEEYEAVPLGATKNAHEFLREIGGEGQPSRSAIDSADSR